MKYKTNTGFTIVELLIVIVVIGILAAITTVAFNGIQERAESTKNISAARSFVAAYKALAQTETLPSAAFCLGEPSVYASGSCSFNGSTGTVNTSLNTKLANFGASSATRLSTRWNNGHLTYHGGWFGQYRILVYHLSPSRDCGLDNVLSGDWNNLQLNGAAYTTRSSTTTLCYIALEKL